MNTFRASVKTLALAVAVAAIPSSSSAQVRVIISGGFSAAYRTLLPEFEKSSGVTVTTMTGGSQGKGPNTIAGQLGRGVAADVVIMNRMGLDDLIKEGRIERGTDVNLAQTYLGLAVRAGAPRPDISTVEAFKQTLLRARSVALDSSTTGIFLTTTLFPRLGIADEMSRKVVMSGAGAIARGEAEIGVQPISELMPVKGIDIVGTIPNEVQYAAVFGAALVTGSQQPEAAKRLIAFLTSDTAKKAIKDSGMEPASR